MRYIEIVQLGQTSINNIFSLRSFALLFLILISFEIQGQDLNPKIILSTYYGNIGTDDADVVTVDLLGNTYLGCHSTSSELLGANKHPYTLIGGMDAFVVKINNIGSNVEYLTHLGGSDWDAIQGITSDSDGNIYAVGTTYSANFPIDTNAFQPTFGGKSDAFVVKLDPKGKVMWSTFLGGSSDEDGRDIVIDQEGNIHVIGRTTSKDFPILINALQPELAGGIDAFIATLDSSGKVIMTTYLGGSGNDIGFAINQDKSGRLYVAGTTNSSDFPVHNAFQTTNHGDDDLFFAVIDAAGKSFEFASYWGGKGSDRCYSMDINSFGELFLLGITNSPDLLITQNAFQQRFNGVTDAFVSKFDLKNQSLVYSTYLGGKKEDSPRNLIVDSSGNAYVVGKTSSDDFPATSHPQSTFQGKTDAFVMILNAEGSNLIYSALFGGNGKETFEGAAIGTDGSLTVSGASNSVNFPLLNPLQDSFLGGRFDIVITRFILPNKE